MGKAEEIFDVETDVFHHLCGDILEGRKDFSQYILVDLQIKLCRVKKLQINNDLHSSPVELFLADIPEPIFQLFALIASKTPVEKTMIQGADTDLYGKRFGIEQFFGKSRHASDQMISSFS
jgi:hypothetical protein